MNRLGSALVIALCSVLLLSACGKAPTLSVPVDPPPENHDDYATRLIRSGLDSTELGRRWLASASDVLNRPTEISLPYSESGDFLAHEPRAIAFQFSGQKGSGLHVDLQRTEPFTGRLFVDVMRVSIDNTGDRYRHLATLPTNVSTLSLALPADGDYLLRIQPELLGRARYALIIESEAPIGFPVEGRTTRSIGSVFGAPRDAGRRQHEGIDIFAPRETPVVAVVDGTAAPRTSRLGGNTVWLRSELGSFYYAHLERAAIARRTSVRKGDILGYVGNSGNAITTPPHLHFGLYRRPRGALDPTELFKSHRYSTRPAADHTLLGYVETTADSLHLRAAPSDDSEIVDELAKGQFLAINGRAGDWLRVLLAGDRSAWMHSRYQRPISVANERMTAQEHQLIFADASARAEPIAVAESGQQLSVFAKTDSALLIGHNPDEPLGWALHDASTSESDAAAAPSDIASAPVTGL